MLSVYICLNVFMSTLGVHKHIYDLKANTHRLKATKLSFELHGIFKKCLWNLKFMDHDGKFQKLDINPAQSSARVTFSSQGLEISLLSLSLSLALQLMWSRWLGAVSPGVCMFPEESGVFVFASGMCWPPFRCAAISTN